MNSLQTTNYKLQTIRGFTLIEILISMSILVFLSSITLINFRSSEKNQFLQLDARHIADALQTIESDAQSGVLTAYPLAKNYGVHFDRIAQTYQLFADNDGNGLWNAVVDTKITDPQKIDTSKRSIISMSAINVTYKWASGACTGAVNTWCTVSVSTIDIAAAVQTVKLSFSPGAGFPPIPAGDTAIFQSVQFVVKNSETGKTANVIIAPLSGRIDVNY